MTSLLAFVGAAVLEIAGFFAFWSWLRLGKSALWLVPGVIALVGFAWLLTIVESPFAGQAYAAYGGIYIAAALVWGWRFAEPSCETWMGRSAFKARSAKARLSS